MKGVTGAAERAAESRAHHHSKYTNEYRGNCPATSTDRAAEECRPSRRRRHRLRVVALDTSRRAAAAESQTLSNAAALVGVGCIPEYAAGSPLRGTLSGLYPTAPTQTQEM